MIPIPTYISQYVIEPKQKGNRLSVKLKCDCGCEKFFLLEKNYTDDEKRVVKEYEKNFPDTGFRSVYGEMDSSGKYRTYIKVFGVFKKYIEIPDVPYFMEINVVKAICSNCKREIILYDNRYHGFNAMINVCDDEDVKKYIPHFKQIGNKLYGIEIEFENEPSIEMFNEYFEEQCSVEFYSNSFGMIKIIGVDEVGKKKVLCDYETD